MFLWQMPFFNEEKARVFGKDLSYLLWANIVLPFKLFYDFI